jgi:hypothetical protein
MTGHGGRPPTMFAVMKISARPMTVKYTQLRTVMANQPGGFRSLLDGASMA